MKTFPWVSLLWVTPMLGSFLYIAQSDAFSKLRALMEGSVEGAAAYVFILVIGVVIAPVTVLPIVPAGAAIFGPLATSVLTIVGWTIGATAAFLIARHLGKPVVGFFIPLEHVEAIERRLSRADEFVGFVLLRMIVPVELLSYGAGLFTRMPLSLYTLATAIGVAPFSFLFSYGGAALASRSYGMLAILSALGGLLFFLVARHYRDLWHS